VWNDQETPVLGGSSFLFIHFRLNASGFYPGISEITAAPATNSLSDAHLETHPKLQPDVSHLASKLFPAAEG